MPVRPRRATLTAVRVEGPKTIEMPAGDTMQAFAGDYLITRGQQVVDLVRSGTLEDRYEPVEEGRLTVSPAVCRRIESTLGIGSTKDARLLAEAIERVATIGIGEVRIEFTPGQLEELKHRATKRGHGVKEEIRAVIDRIRDEIFWKG